MTPHPHLLYVVPLAPSRPAQATPDACHAEVCRWLQERAAQHGLPLVLPSVVIESTDGNATRASAFLAA